MDQIAGYQSWLIKISATLAIFALEPTGLRAEVPAQAGTGIRLGMSEAKRLSPNDVHDRGIKLRADLDKAFNALEGNTKAGHADEFTVIVHPYISAGMGLEDAEAILRAAGFAPPSSPRAREKQDQSRDRYAVVAEIPQFAGRVFGNVEIYVTLLSPEQGLAEFAGRRHRLTYFPLP